MRLGPLAIALLLCACGGGQASLQPSPVAHASGPLGDSWSFDGTGWHASNATGPAPRYLAAIAYDAAHHDYVLFGGQTATDSSDETWTFDGRSWKKLTPAHKPPPRRNAALAYDPAHRYVLLYGGEINLGEGEDAADTWSWDGTDWTLHPGDDRAPGPRDGPRMVSIAAGVLLFGGHNANTVYLSDVWTWDGARWSRVGAGTGPPGREAAALAWDPQHSSLFVFGGTGINTAAGPGANGLPLGDAWTLTDGRWTQLSGAGPPALSEPAAIREAASGRIDVLLGMACPDPVASAWGWDGSSWTRLPDPGMSARWGAAVAQAPDGTALLFGGSNETGC